jgi:hypothetical protein
MALSLDASPPGIYRQRGTSSLQKLFRAHFPDLHARYEADFAKRLGRFRLERISSAVERFLDPRAAAALARREPRMPRHRTPRPTPASAHRRPVPEARPHHGAAFRTSMSSAAFSHPWPEAVRRDAAVLEALRVLDNSVRLDGGDHAARQALTQYIARAPLSLQKLTYDRSGGMVLYHTSYNLVVGRRSTLFQTKHQPVERPRFHRLSYAVHTQDGSRLRG